MNSQQFTPMLNRLTTNELLGFRQNIYRDCPTCDGAGAALITVHDGHENFVMAYTAICGDCMGQGQVPVYQTN